MTLKQANELVAKLHRHHKPAVGHRFSLGAKLGDQLVGAAIIGRPVARACDQYFTAEVVRLVTDGTPHVCSFLYSAAARVWREMGGHKIQTYILDTEPGTSLVAAGWSFEDKTGGGHWSDWDNGKKVIKRRSDQPECPKQRWAKVLKAVKAA